MNINTMPAGSDDGSDWEPMFDWEPMDEESPLFFRADFETLDALEAAPKPMRFHEFKQRFLSGRIVWPSYQRDCDSDDWQDEDELTRLDDSGEDETEPP